MPDIVRLIADDVVAALNAVVWSPALVATRYYIVDIEAINDTLAASVMGSRWTANQEMRHRDKVTPAVGIAIHQRLPDSRVETVDPLVDLVAAIRQHFLRWRSPTTGAVVTSRKCEPLYQEKLLRENLVFLAFLELELLITEAAP